MDAWMPGGIKENSPQTSKNDAQFSDSLNFAVLADLLLVPDFTGNQNDYGGTWMISSLTFDSGTAWRCLDWKIQSLDMAGENCDYFVNLINLIGAGQCLDYYQVADLLSVVNWAHIHNAPWPAEALANHLNSLLITPEALDFFHAELDRGSTEIPAEVLVLLSDRIVADYEQADMRFQEARYQFAEELANFNAQMAEDYIEASDDVLLVPTHLFQDYQ